MVLAYTVLATPSASPAKRGLTRVKWGLARNIFFEKSRFCSGAEQHDLGVTGVQLDRQVGAKKMCEKSKLRPRPERYDLGVTGVQFDRLQEIFLGYEKLNLFPCPERYDFGVTRV